jgi:hypothetical protein
LTGSKRGLLPIEPPFSNVELDADRTDEVAWSTDTPPPRHTDEKTGALSGRILWFPK